MVAKGLEAAAITFKRIVRWKEAISKEATAIGVPSSVVAAIISRETSGLDIYCQPPPTGRLGDGGAGAGPMQIDVRSFPAWHALWKTGQLKVEDGIHMGCHVLALKLGEAKKLWPEVDVTEQLHRAIAGYNCGTYNVAKALKNKREIDAYTTGHDYSTDVVARASYFLEKGFA